MYTCQPCLSSGVQCVALISVKVARANRFEPKSPVVLFVFSCFFFFCDVAFFPLACLLFFALLEGMVVEVKVSVDVLWPRVAIVLSFVVVKRCAA